MPKFHQSLNNRIKSKIYQKFSFSLMQDVDKNCWSYKAPEKNIHQWLVLKEYYIL